MAPNTIVKIKIVTKLKLKKKNNKKKNRKKLNYKKKKKSGWA